VCGSLALAACGGDDDDEAKDAIQDALDGAGGGDGNGGGETSVPSGGVLNGAEDPSDLPDDACTAVPAQITDKLAPGNRVEGPTSQSAQGMALAGCAWVNDTVTLNLNYTAGVSPDLLEMSLEAEMKDGNGEITRIGGDEAGIKTAAGGQLEVTVLHEDVQVDVSLLTLQDDASTHKADVVAMAEAAVGSL